MYDWKDKNGNPVIARSVDAQVGVFLCRSGVVSTQMAVGLVEIEDEHDKHRIFFVSFSFEDTNLNLIFYVPCSSMFDIVVFLTVGSLL